MDIPDIICLILDELLQTDDADSLCHCKYINQLWYGILTELPKYLKNRIVFAYLLVNKPSYLYLIQASMDRLIRRFEFIHPWLRKTKTIRLRAILISFPNRQLNFLTLDPSYEVEVKIIIENWLKDIFGINTSEKIDKLVDMHKKIYSETVLDKLNLIYNQYYSKGDILNKITWIFIWINMLGLERSKLKRIDKLVTRHNKTIQYFIH